MSRHLPLIADGIKAGCQVILHLAHFGCRTYGACFFNQLTQGSRTWAKLFRPVRGWCLFISKYVDIPDLSAIFTAE
jgi:hypothetical protein